MEIHGTKTLTQVVADPQGNITTSAAVLQGNVIFATVKLSDGQTCTAGSIIYRQRGTKILPGNNVGRGGDDTLFAKVDGVVKYERVGKKKKQVSVYPVA